ncbi:MAG: hypothetical protein EZS28_004298 [Streblomastix strix]|uniref:Uncharacterized protein n=1 Tax=Streblomastix strix TaxID=222440 RepID=A0A5J4WZ85_9EUKA|nr:MAG: hypothetical protein EZS28_004298 [Streblomastix strix]
MENLETVGFLGKCQINGITIISLVLALVVASRTVVQSWLVQTSPAVESIVLVSSQLRSSGLLAGPLSAFLHLYPDIS